MTKRMDILFVSRCLPGPIVSGDRVILHHVAHQLRSRGHNLDLLGFHLGDAESDTSPWAEPFRYIEAVRERPRSPWDYLLRLAHPFPDAGGQCWNPTMWEAIDRRMSAQRYDLVHFIGGIQVYEFRNLVGARRPTVITPYDSYSRHLEIALRQATQARDRLRLRARLYLARRYESLIFGGFGRVVMVTEAEEADMRRLAPGLPTAVIPNGVDGAYFRPGRVRGETSTLVFVGNLAYPPNAEAACSLATEVLPTVRTRVAGANALVVGPGPPADLVALEGPDLRITGLVPDIRPYLQRSACFVSPLASGSGMRNKILEAMAMEVPVVATPLSCEGIRVTEGEDVLLASTPEDLAAAATRILVDGGLRREIGAGGRRLVLRDHTWERAADLYEGVYAEVVSEWARDGEGQGGPP